MVAGDVKAADVVEAAVVRFADDGIDRPHALVAGLRECVTHEGVHRHAHAQGVGQNNRRFDRAELGHLRGSRQLAERVADEHGAGDLVLKYVAAVGNDSGDARAYVVAFDERCVSDTDAVHVGDRVERPRRQHARRNPEITRAGLLLR